MNDETEDQVESARVNSSCPTIQKLRHWLDGREQLTTSEMIHIRQCDVCQLHLERFTEAADLLGGSVSSRLSDESFAGEPALASLQRALATPPNTPNTLHETMEETPSQVDSQQQSDSRGPSRTRELNWLNKHFDPSRYTVEGVIGRGGNADVFRVYDALLDRHFAVKTIASDYDRGRTRMLREAKLLAEIDHPNILRVLDVGQVDAIDGNPAIYICMEYMAGGTLGDLFDGIPNQPADFRMIAELLAGACDGLSEAHSKGIVHRDLKPANILLDEDHLTAKVADFGLATRNSDYQTMLTRTGAIIGTPAFMSPEQASAADNVGPDSDLYSIGATLYFMLTGQVPFSGPPAAVVRQIIDTDPVSPSLLNERVPRELIAICERSMEKERPKRYASASQLAADLRAFASGERVNAKPISSIGRLVRQLRRDRKLYLAIQAAFGLAAALLLVSVVSAAVFRSQSNRLAKAAMREKEDQQRLQASLERAIDAADQLLVSVTEDLSLLPSTPGSDRVSNTLLLRAQEYYDQFLSENKGNSQLQFQLARAHVGLARIAFRRGDISQGREQSSKARALLVGIQRGDEATDGDRDVDLLLARLLLDLGTSLGKANPADTEADDALSECIQLSRQLVQTKNIERKMPESDPYYVEASTLLTSALRNRSALLGRVGRDGEAGDLAREAVERSRSLVARPDVAGRSLLASAMAHQTLGLYQIQHQEFDQGAIAIDEALSLLGRIDASERVALRAEPVEANLHSNRARIAMQKGDLDKAAEEQRVAIAIHQRLSALEPDVPSHRSDLVDALLNASNIEYAAERFDNVLADTETAIKVLAELIVLDEGNPEHLQTKAMLQGNIAIVQLHLGNPLLSIQPLTESLVDLEVAAKMLNHASSAEIAIALNHYSLAGAYYDLGQFDQALSSLDRCDEITAEVLAQHPDFDLAIDHMIDSLFRRTDILLEVEPVDTEEIIRCTNQADTFSDALIRGAPDVIGYTSRRLLMLTTRGEAHRRAGDLDAALDDADYVIAQATQLQPESDAGVFSDALQYAYLLRYDALQNQLELASDDEVTASLQDEIAIARDQALRFGAPADELDQ